MDARSARTKDPLLDLLFDDPLAGRCLLDPEGRVLRANGTWLDARGLEEAGVLGVELAALLPEPREATLALHARARAGQRVEVPPCRAVAGARETWWEGALDPVPAPGGVGLLLTERAVTRSEARGARDAAPSAPPRSPLRSLSSMVEDSGGFVAVCALDLRPVFVNDAGRSMVGIGDRDVSAIPMLDYFWPEDRPLVEAEALPALVRDGRWSGEVRFRHFESGAPVPTMLNAFTLRDETGAPVGYATISPDLTQVRRDEARLREALDVAERNTATLDAILQAIPHAVYFGDATGIARCNALALRMFGAATLEDLRARSGASGARLGVRRRPDGELVEPGDLPFARALRGEAASLDTWVARVDTGEEVLVRGNSAPVVVGGRVVGAVGVDIDITDQHRLQTQWQLAAAELGWWHYDPVRGVSTFDARFARIFGVEGRTLDDARFLALVHPDDVVAARAAVEATFAPEAARTYSVEYRIVRPDGTVRWIEAHGQAVFTAGKAPQRTTGFVGTVEDVSDRKRAEEELRRLAAAVEQTPASIVITDHRGVIEYVNPGFERVTGYARAEAVGNRPSVLKSGRHDADFYRTLWETIASGQVWKGQLVNRSRDGRLFTEDAVIAPVFDAQGVIRNYVAVKRDVTEDLRLQEGLAQAQRLESIGRLAGGVAHDFNNLLTVILSASEALRLDLRDGTDIQAEDVEEITAAGRRAAELTRQLLAFARKQAISPTRVDLNAVVVGMERLLRRVLGEDVALVVNLAPGLWPTYCDQGQLEQVVMNLAVNARDAMPSGGTLTLETQNVPPGNTAPRAGDDAWVALRVRDTGVGIAPEVRAHLFEPFFTTKPQGKGTGLGLATVHGIVSQSGGDVGVESEPGCGATFVVRLPRWDGPHVDRATPLQQHPARGTEAILLVEDDAAVREVARRALEGAGYRLAVASSGAEALSALERSPADRPALMVTDMVMPGMNGHELAAQLRAGHPGLRVLFVSGYDPDPAQGAALDGGREFLSKPFTPSGAPRQGPGDAGRGLAEAGRGLPTPRPPASRPAAPAPAPGRTPTRGSASRGGRPP